jgi:two-component system, cell cycle sensor histidine kinase and response regulator CckA
MDELELVKYKEYVHDNLDKMIGLFAHISMDDFSKRVDLSGLMDDDFMRAFCGLDLMMDDLIETGAKYRRIRERLEKTVEERTAELAGANRMLKIDNAERKKAETALAEREKFLSEVFASIQDPISVLDTTLTIVRVNATMERWYAEKMPITGKKCYWVYHNRATPCTHCPSIRTIAGGGFFSEVVDKCDAQGKKVGWSEVNAFPWRDAETGKLLGVIEHVRDVTERVKLENELFKIKKLESLGVLAGGIAHDFNNILMGIMGNVSLARMKQADDPSVPGLLVEAEKASLRASKLVGQLLTFSKGGAPVKELVSVNGLVEETAGFCLSGTNIKYNLDLAPDCRAVEVDRSQIDQVLNNLIINAVQAMPDGGAVHISSRNVTLSAPLPAADLRLGTPVPGEYVKVSVRDEGGGIPRENFEKVFDPYFTTKKKGNGLGLSIVFSIINRHRGAITLDSRVGEGTTISIYLPASDKPGLRTEDQKSIEATPAGGRVLVLDDDMLVRITMEKMLTQAGYRVVGTSHGEETVAKYADSIKSGNPFDLVIMDLTIPGGMGGREAVARVLGLNPAAVVIVASGYSNDPVMSNYRKYGFSGAINKPFQYGELLRVLESVGSGDRGKEKDNQHPSVSASR